MANSHGHTPAAWTGVIIAFVGFCVGSVFMVLAEPIGVAASVVIILIGAVVGGLMRAAGLGQPKTNGLTEAQLQAHRQTHAEARS
ncbi:HGxxPAAW family protein [Streptomyces iconiensis]|uniref:HGxxPAAW family protein n=1 Tax=Streptomyces iconiensis TaxID=1384038 RepID=A0ABT7A341_9ACTN|nr:HGxxPAAW family protein [Streptomyces iconiensis]MDJ1135281.1 HGxxPAAW family protein [Streptomyces iconiensis]